MVPESIACEYGPIAAGAFPVLMIVRDRISSRHRNTVMVQKSFPSVNGRKLRCFVNRLGRNRAFLAQKCIFFAILLKILPDFRAGCVSLGVFLVSSAAIRFR